MEELEELEKTKKLTAKQEIFCQEFVKTLSMTIAYKNAYGIKDRENARKLGSRLMSNDAVKKRVEELKAEIVQTYQISREQLIEMSMRVYNMAAQGTPEKKLNREGKFVDTGNKTYDYRAMNDALKNIAAMSGLNSQEIKASINAQVESDVKVVTAKDIANELMKK